VFKIEETSMSDCCSDTQFDGASPAYRRVLVAVIAINAVMFAIEMSAGFSAQSQALKADALDFAGDSATYAISLAVLGRSLEVRARASLLKGASLAVMAAVILGMAVSRFFGETVPESGTMSLIGILALLANLAALGLLLKWRKGDANVRSVWLCSRNDAVGNVGVVLAAGLVGLTGSAWPDLLMAIALAGLFLRSSWSIIVQARHELRQRPVCDRTRMPDTEPPPWGGASERARH
jgi:Co/Zn/Cd efflux system component